MLGTDDDPDPQKRCGSDTIRIRIYNTGGWPTFSPLCFLLCWRRWEGRLKLFKQMSHSCFLQQNMITIKIKRGTESKKACRCRCSMVSLLMPIVAIPDHLCFPPIFISRIQMCSIRRANRTQAYTDPSKKKGRYNKVSVVCVCYGTYFCSIFTPSLSGNTPGRELEKNKLFKKDIFQSPTIYRHLHFCVPRLFFSRIQMLVQRLQSFFVVLFRNLSLT